MGLICLMSRDMLSFLPYLEWRVWHVSVITRHDYLQAYLFQIDLANSPFCPLCKSVPMTGEHLSDCPALLHVLSQDNFGVLPLAKATSTLYWTARCLLSKRMFGGHNLERQLVYINL
ncbi:hypothetical protein TNCV_2775721 [Trichonephila clavipes]|nr:hypothetical protein TNCV_2775721 [Trichonephila clavipes]